MKKVLAGVSLLACLTIVPLHVYADPQQDLAAPQEGQSLESQQNQGRELIPPQKNQILELPPLRNGALAPPPQPLPHPEIPSVFIGCWEGTIDRWDSEEGNFQGVTIGSGGRIVFCYRRNHIEVPVAELKAEFGASAWFKDLVSQMGVSLAFVKVDRSGISNTIYAITPSQIYARTFVPLSIIGPWRWLLPVPRHPVLVEEELAQKKDLDHLSIQARQELEVDGLPAVRAWHADFHRTVDPD